ncbi:sulfite oxidase [Kitasatospora cinereorecta]|uniref:Sulfite oxidase n=1 Tax=Kitasatospora cinereorecta TaxID=285560 RepID=A0ABW0VB99_9ACTN
MGPPETVTVEPYNAQTPADALGPHLTAADALFVRSHFEVARIPADRWRLRVGEHAEFGYRELLAMGRHEVETVLECAGNGRSLMSPVPPGLPWGERAVGCARFAGVPFRVVAERAGLTGDAVEYVFTGADRGVVDGRSVPFERSLPVAAALDGDTLLATELNGRPLTPEHGAPVRLVAPGRYGVADVKWLVAVRAVDEQFDGPFQGGSYVYREAVGTPEGPVGAVRVRSLVTDPAPGAELAAGREAVLRGHAWSGGPPVRLVEVRVDEGPWAAAELVPGDGRYAWSDWSHRWTPPGPGRYRITVRATDAEGAVQPLAAPWNADGYGCNPAAVVEVVAVEVAVGDAAPG